MFDAQPELAPNDPRQDMLQKRLAASRHFRDQILANSAANVEVDAPVLVALGNDLTPQLTAFGRTIRGKPHIACPVFEDVECVGRNIAKLKEYDAIVVASRWNQEVLGGLGIEAKLCHEGIDPLIFNPSVRRKRNDGKFRVFSGGKPEWRKGCDLVIEAFRQFAETHDDAVLVAAWGSPFGAAGEDFEGRWKYGAPPGGHIGRPNFHAWVERAGIKPHQFEFVEPRANWRMAEVYGGCDVAIFPNRCEGGTNFVAMECIACGVPTIIKSAFGQTDLMPQFEFGENMGPALLSEVLAHFYQSGAVSRGCSEYWTWERHCREMQEIIANA